MKRVVLSIILFIALCAVAAGSYLYIVGTTTRLLNKVEFVAHSFTDGDYGAAFTAAEEADEMWVQFRKRRFLIIDRDNVAEITAALARIKSLADGEKHELLTECAAVAALLRHYVENQKVNLYNVL
ncbi:MAG: DUF4363 family protein [Oscillospiraceae bacterium]|jgi:hypothetical protein|nr:DUF4363 family protein [Oscillospiraceae bacterium]